MSARGRSTDHMYTYCAALRLEASHIRDWRTLMKKTNRNHVNSSTCSNRILYCIFDKDSRCCCIYDENKHTIHRHIYRHRCNKVFCEKQNQKVSKRQSTKHIIVAKLNGTTLKYHKSTMNTNLKGNSDWEWENIVGYGKKKSIKVAKNCKYYILGNDIHTVKRPQKEIPETPIQL